MQTTTLSLLLALAFAPPPQSDVQEPLPRNVAIVLFDGVELLDFAGPGEVFSVAMHDGAEAFNTYTVATTRERLTSQGFVHITPQYTLEDCPAPDIVVLPGGRVPRGDEALGQWLLKQNERTELMMSVCNGATLFGSLGLLDGLEVTTHHGSWTRLAELAPKAKVLVNRRFIDNGHVLTCAGVSAGMDGALHVVARLCSPASATATARYMEYDWRPDEIAALHASAPRGVAESSMMQLVDLAVLEGIPAAMTAYRAMPGTEQPTEGELNSTGYALLRSGKAAAARRLLELTCELFPQSSNSADSLSEVLESQGESERALARARHVLELLEAETGLTANRRALIANAAGSRIARLTGDTEKLRFRCPPCDHPCDDYLYIAQTKCPGCSMQLVPIDD